VQIGIPAYAWREGVTPKRGEFGLATYDYEYGKMYDTMIEVLDPRSGTIVAQYRAPGFFLHQLGDGYLASVYQDDNGAPFVRLWKAELVGR
jgi:hypothetical protein